MSQAHSHGGLIVVGSGPGDGRAVAALLAERGYQKVTLFARNAFCLAEDAQAVRAASPSATVHEVAVDVGDTDKLQKAYCLGNTSLECVLFNTARIVSSKSFDFRIEELENNLKVHWRPHLIIIVSSFDELIIFYRSQ